MKAFSMVVPSRVPLCSLYGGTHYCTVAPFVLVVSGIQKSCMACCMSARYIKNNSNSETLQFSF